MGRHNRMTTADISIPWTTIQQGNSMATGLLNLEKYTGLDLLLQLAPQFLD